MKRQDDERGKLVQGQSTDVIIHILLRGYRRKGVHHQRALELLLEVLERVDELLRHGAVGVGSLLLLELVADEEWGGAADELDELEHVGADRVLLGRECGLEEVYCWGNVVGSVDACEDSKLAVRLEVEDVSLCVVPCVFLHRVVEVGQDHWYCCGVQDDAHHHQSEHVIGHSLH